MLDYEKQLREELADLVVSVQSDIDNYDRAFDDEYDVAGIQLTVAVDNAQQIRDCDYVYQTGDNSYTGACYHRQHWAVTGIYRESDPMEVAEDLIDQLVDLAAE